MSTRILLHQVWTARNNKHLLNLTVPASRHLKYSHQSQTSQYSARRLLSTWNLSQATRLHGKWNKSTYFEKALCAFENRVFSTRARNINTTSSSSLSEDTDENEEAFMKHFIDNTHKFKFMSVRQLEEEVECLESLTRPQSWDESFSAAIFPLMKSCAQLHSVRGAKLTERILARCIVESSSYCYEKNEGNDDDGIQLNQNDISSTESIDLSFSESLDKKNSFPSSEMYSIAIDAWGKSEARGGYGAKRAEQILKLMISEYIQNMKLRRRTLLRFQNIQKDMQDTTINNDTNGKPNHSNSLKKNTDSKSISSMTPFLPKPAAKPDVVNYAAVISAWARSGRKDAVKQVQRIFDQIQSNTSEAINFNVQPDTVCFNAVMSAWSHSRNKNALRKVESLFRDLINLHEKTKQPNLHPTNYTYSILIDAYARYISLPNKLTTTETKQIIQRVEALLYEIQKAYKTNPNSPLRPDTITYNSLLNVISRAGNPQRAEMILDQMIMMQAEAYASGDFDLLVKPNVSSYNTIINGWACVASGQSGRQAERILQRISEDNGGLQPNIISYNSVINAHVKSGVTDAAENAQRILDEMIAVNYGSTSEVDTESSQESLLQIYQNSNLKKSAIPKPNTVTFGTVIHAWSLSSNPKAPFYAESLLNQMETLHESGNFPNLIPNRRCFQGVISSFRNVKNGEKAEEILLRLNEMCEKGDDERFVKANTPNTYLYNIVLSAWIHDVSNPLQKARRAQALLKWMEHVYHQRVDDDSVRPNVDSYNTVIEVCGSLGSLNADEGWKNDDGNDFHSDVRREAFSISVDVFNSLCDRASKYEKMKPVVRKRQRLENSKQISPNSETYVQMLKAISSLLPPESSERSDLAQKIFLQCCQDALVDDRVLNEFKKATTKETFIACIMKLKEDDQDHSEIDDLDLRDLPSKYKCNDSHQVKK